jgi:hypothetical protein
VESMDSRVPRSIRVLTERLSRREALQAYVPPALSMIVLAGAKNSRNFGSLGVERVEVRGGGNPGNDGGGGNNGNGGGGDNAQPVNVEPVNVEPVNVEPSNGGGGGNGGGNNGGGGGNGGGGRDDKKK